MHSYFRHISILWGLYSVCGVKSQACFVRNPAEVPGEACVDAVLALLGALLSPADDARKEPGVLVLGGVGSAAVPLACILLHGAVSSAEHEAGHLFAAAPLAIGAIHIRHLHLLQRG